MFVFGLRHLFPIFQVQTSPIALFLAMVHIRTLYVLFYDHSGCTTYTPYQSQGSNGKYASPRVSTSGFVPSTVGQSLIFSAPKGFGASVLSKTTSFQVISFLTVIHLHLGQILDAQARM